MFVDGMIALHGTRPRLIHMLLEETPLPPRVHEFMRASEAEATRAVAELLRRCPEVRRRNLDQVAVMVVGVVESLTHRFAAHPDENLSGRAFAVELVRMLESYLTAGDDG